MSKRIEVKFHTYKKPPENIAERIGKIIIGLLVFSYVVIIAYFIYKNI